MYARIARRLFTEFAVDFAYFPLWWYTQGFLRFLHVAKNLMSAANASLAPALWLKNIFVPMYGQWDWQGRVMSFLMRSINILGRSIAILVWSLGVLALIIAWLVFPPSVIILFFASL